MENSNHCEHCDDNVKHSGTAHGFSMARTVSSFHRTYRLALPWAQLVSSDHNNVIVCCICGRQFSIFLVYACWELEQERLYGKLWGYPMKKCNCSQLEKWNWMIERINEYCRVVALHILDTAQQALQRQRSTALNSRGKWEWKETRYMSIAEWWKGKINHNQTNLIFIQILRELDEILSIAYIHMQCTRRKRRSEELRSGVVYQRIEI